MAKIFLSYSRKDSAVARKLIDAFKDMGHDPWVDWEDIPPAVGWLEQIFQGIEGSDAFFFLVSPDSVASEVCGVEVSKAEENNKRIIPIVVRDVNTREVKVHPTVGELNWIRLREGDSFEEALALIKIAIELDIDWVEEHSRLQLRALEWHRANESSLLLRGNDLRKTRAAVMEHKNTNPRPTEIQGTYVDRSNQDERRRYILWFMTTIAVILLAGLTWYALIQRNEAQVNEKLAREQETLAKQNEAIANENRIAAELNEAEASRQAAAARAAQITAEAQRSAAKAQIYQSRTGELYTSTLLAIDSWQGEPSDEAEEILRRNISLLPLPIAQFGHTGSINSLLMSADGKTILTASADKTACLWNLDNGSKRFCATSPEAVNDAVFNRDESLIITGDESGLVQILSAEDGSVQFDINYRVPIRNLDVRPDGRLLAITKADGIINIFDLNQRKESFFLQTTGSVYQSGFSPNGRYFATGSTLGIVTLWNLDTDQIFSESKHRGEVLALAFSPNSQYLITGGKDGYSVFTYTFSGESTFKNPHEDWVDGIAFSPKDGTWYATVSHDKKIRVWETLSNTERIRMAQDSFVEAVVVSADGQWIATTGSDKTVRVWNASTGAEMYQIPIKSAGTELAFSPDGKYLITGDANGGMGIWDLSTTPIPEKSYLFNGLVGDIQFDTTGDVLAASDENRIWRLNPNDTASPTTTLQDDPYLEQRSIVKELEFGADPKFLAVSTTADQIFIDVFGAQLTSRALTTTGVIEAIAFSSGQEQFITASSNGLVQAWNYTGGKSSDPIILFEDASVKSLAASGSLLAIGAAEKVMLIDLSGRSANQELASPGDNFLLAFSADGSKLASASSSGEIHIWRVVDGQYVLSHTLQKAGTISLAINAGGSTIAVGTTNSALLLDTTSGEEWGRIPHAGTVSAASFAGDNILATASSRFVQLWDISKLTPIPKDALVDEACSRMIENLDQALWSALFGGKEYRLLCPGL
jgi:WD40 repeat protein